MWGNTDDAANSVIWAVTQLNLPANTVNRDNLFGNTTADAFMTDMTVGQYGVSTAEMQGTKGVLTATVTNPGSGFTARPTATANNTGTGGTGATFTATAKVVSIAVGDNAGTGYTNGNIVTIAGGTGTSATATVTTDPASVATIAIGDNAGTGYTNNDIVTVAGGTGTPATGTVTTDGDGIVTAIALTTAGAYSVVPSINENVVTGGSGTGLTVDLTLIEGVVASLALATAGSYTVLPTRNENAVTGGSGTGLTADIALGLGSITVTADGDGYTTAPAIVIGGAGGTGATATAALQSAGEASEVPHAGWNLRTEGAGGRAGRVHYECLVAMGTITGDASDDTLLPE